MAEKINEETVSSNGVVRREQRLYQEPSLRNPLHYSCGEILSTVPKTSRGKRLCFAQKIRKTDLLRWEEDKSAQWRGVLCDLSIDLPFKPTENDR